MDKEDREFYERADQHINTSNDQLAGASAGQVSASMVYGVSRFNAWNSARGFENKAQMKEAKQEVLDYFQKQYMKMLEENLDDYIDNFDTYLKKK